ncbi:ABC transporter ATP-binding protein [Roseovarius atlanticus]|uniref:ABC transporter ATP-binding protein n=1 Tax=Roseovarius atlanticus TaxID=1641875 RepID=UPI001C945976|nr:ABC transporter ATP-binding protein [Roseovarius atlanticus]MBY5987201.1 ABC transporter ATP-binding protein [Roseovarius atlanticus]MBY6125841.1 ABC transporter ATP-binding protein [Roseovarius atlanticus]MBY6149698.1 ABC transporter ATP-binding protein [Roseovarius atlanticus]
MSDQALLDVSELTSGYGKETVLQGVDLRIGPGELVAVIGRNGVGKSTLMRTLTGLMKARSGSIRLGGVDVTGSNANDRARAGIGYIPQGREVFPELTIRENLLVGEVAGKGRGAPDYDRVYRFFPILKERARQRAGTLSGGQQQQLAIARAMIADPRLMLLDEPSEGIQPSIIKDIARNVRTLNAETGVAVLLVEQNLDLIVSLADRGYVMEKGRITATLGPDEIRDRDQVRRHLTI